MKLLRKQLLHAMIDREMNYREIAESIGMNRVTINNILNGQNTTFETAVKIAKALKVDVFDLIDKEN